MSHSEFSLLFSCIYMRCKSGIFKMTAATQMMKAMSNVVVETDTTFTKQRIKGFFLYCCMFSLYTFLNKECFLTKHSIKSLVTIKLLIMFIGTKQFASTYLATTYKNL